MRNLIIVAVLMTMLAGCSRGMEESGTPGPEAGPAASQAPDTGAEEHARSGELAGTAWRLLKIAGMDDSTDVPDDPSKYTLVLNPDGSAAMQADCNRGAGTWTSESPGQLVFGPVVSTRAMCPEGSISEKYLAQFEWVRSYVIEDGHLFIATMADGAIVEFEPAGSD